ncbi:RND transporter, partial [Burkholderia sp. Tr-849]|nr:RND transporter [Burkholderia sp. Tr-849]
NARLDEIRATGARFADTARLYQAMGTPPVDKPGQSGKTDKAADATATGQQARAAGADTPPSPQ